MKVFTQRENLLGKKVFKDERIEKLKEKFSPQKVSFISIDFIAERRESCDVLLVVEEEVLDLIVEDIERAERLLEKNGFQYKEVVKKILEALDRQVFVKNCLNDEEKKLVKDYGFITAKPVIVINDDIDSGNIIPKILEEAGYICFFTAGRKEVRAWLLEKGANIVDAAGRIHSDLARGFIKADVFNIRDIDLFKNLAEAKQKGLVKSVDRDYIVEDGDVIEIKFSVSR